MSHLAAQVWTVLAVAAALHATIGERSFRLCCRCGRISLCWSLRGSVADGMEAGAAILGDEAVAVTPKGKRGGDQQSGRGTRPKLCRGRRKVGFLSFVLLFLFLYTQKFSCAPLFRLLARRRAVVGVKAPAKAAIFLRRNLAGCLLPLGCRCLLVRRRDCGCGRGLCCRRGGGLKVLQLPQRHMLVTVPHRGLLQCLQGAAGVGVV